MNYHLQRMVICPQARGFAIATVIATDEVIQSIS